MSIKTTAETVVAVDTTEVFTSVERTIDTESSRLNVDITPPQEVVAVKKEYSIVGDQFYAGVNSGIAPEWLTNLIDSVVAASVANGLTDYDSLVQDVRNAIDSIDVAKNTYVEQINFTELVDGIIGTHLTTLNATYNGKFATIVELNTVASNAEYALATKVTDLKANFNSTINSRISDISLAYSSADEALANSITSLTSAFSDQEKNIAGSASAIEGLQTYVGLDKTNSTPNGLGILSRVNILEKQNDGVIEYIINTYDVISGIEEGINDTENDELIVDALPYVLWTELSGVGVPTDTTRPYMDYSLETPATAYADILDNTVYVRSDFTDNDTDRYYVFFEGTWTSMTSAEYTAKREVLRASHVADVYIKYSTDVNGTKIYQRSYKFIKSAVDNTSPYSTDADGYAWAIVSDTDAQASYVTALSAKDLADSKRRVFVAEPYAPYDEGDLWIDATGPVQVVKVAVSSVPLGGSFLASHWEIADEYAKDFVDNTYTPDSAQLHRQIDGKVEYYFYESYEDIAGATSEATALDIIDNAWNTNELKDAANGNVVYFKDSKNAFWYQSGTTAWIAVIDTSIYEGLQDAANAQATADGRLSHFYAWGDMENGGSPSNYAVETKDGEEIISAEGVTFWFTGGTLYEKGATWTAKVEVPTSAGDGQFISVGDLLTVFDPVTGDISTYNYNGSWVLNGPDGLVSKSKWFTELSNDVYGPNGHMASALSELSIDNRAYTDGVTTSAESNFGYNSKLIVDGKVYESGFGLESVGSSTGTDVGTGLPTFNSKFRINAEKLILTSPSHPGVEAQLGITASGLMLGLDQTEATKNEAKGAHTTASTYDKGDIVTSNGSSYIAVKSVPLSTSITNTYYWNLLAQKGEDGPVSTTPGPKGTRGTAVLTYSYGFSSGVSIEDAKENISGFWNNAASSEYDAEIKGDVLVLTNTNSTDGWTHIYEFNGSTWTAANTFVVNGSQVVKGTLSADALVTDVVFGEEATFNGSIKGGKESFTDTSSGYWMGNENGEAKLNIGNGNSFIKWSNNTLEVQGNIAFGKYVDSSSVLMSLLEQVDSTFSSFILAKSIRLITSGTIRLGFDVKCDSHTELIEVPAYKIVKNGKVISSGNIYNTGWVNVEVPITFSDTAPVFELWIKGGTEEDETGTEVSVGVHMINPYVKAERVSGEEIF